jgi:hypothetical protein
MIGNAFGHSLLIEILEEPEAQNKTYDENSEKVKAIAEDILKKSTKGNIHNRF